MSQSSPFSASIPGNYGNHHHKDECLSLESEDDTKLFLHYTAEDPFAKIKSPSSYPRPTARLEGSKGLQGDCEITVYKPIYSAQNGQFLAPNPCINCQVTDIDSENVVDEMAPRKLEEDLVSDTSSPFNVIKDPVSQDPRLAELELSKRHENRQQETKKNGWTNDNLVISRYGGSYDENDLIGLDTVESVARYVKDPLLELRKDIRDFGIFEQLKPDQDNDIEEVFFDFNSPCQGDSIVPDTKAGENYVGSNTLSPSVVVFTPIQDPVSSVVKEPHFLNSSQHSSSINSEALMHSKGTGSNTSGSRLSYFSYLGEDLLSKSWSRSSTTSSFYNSGTQRMTSVSSYAAESSPGYPNALSPSGNHFQFTSEECDGPDKLDQCIDYCSCMCCINALFYHCTKDDDCDSTTYSEPCQCQEPNKGCLKRWGFLSVLTCCMPCLLFYAPLRCLQKTAKRIKRMFRRNVKSKS